MREYIIAHHSNRYWTLLNFNLNLIVRTVNKIQFQENWSKPMKLKYFFTFWQVFLNNLRSAGELPHVLHHYQPPAQPGGDGAGHQLTHVLQHHTGKLANSTMRMMITMTVISTVTMKFTMRTTVNMMTTMTPLMTMISNCTKPHTIDGQNQHENQHHHDDHLDHDDKPSQRWAQITIFVISSPKYPQTTFKCIK